MQYTFSRNDTYDAIKDGMCWFIVCTYQNTHTHKRKNNTKHMKLKGDIKIFVIFQCMSWTYQIKHG